MAGIRELNPFWQNSYTEYGDFWNENFIEREVFTICFVTESFLSLHQRVLSTTEGEEACP
jgi:hypothetical protein